MSLSDRSLKPITSSREGDLFLTLHREINNFLNDFWKRPMLKSSFPLSDSDRMILPDINVTENEKAFQVTAELPGMEEKDIKIELHNNLLTLKGEKKVEKAEKGTNYCVSERSTGFFHRNIQLPAKVNEDKVEAIVKNGVLTIILPKSEQSAAQTKKIEIKKG